MNISVDGDMASISNGSTLIRALTTSQTRRIGDVAILQVVQVDH